MAYKRVAPRDLFNESKLLKCLGQLALLIHDKAAPEELSFYDTGNRYKIEQRDMDGGIECVSGICFYHNYSKLTLYHPLNNKEPYPLLLEIDDVSYEVFYDDGTLTSDFLLALREL